MKLNKPVLDTYMKYKQSIASGTPLLLYLLKRHSSDVHLLYMEEELQAP